MSSSTSHRIDPDNRSVPPVPDRLPPVPDRLPPAPRGSQHTAKPHGATPLAYRIDPPHRVVAAGNASAEAPPVEEIPVDDGSEPDWMAFQAADLVGHLRAWSADLDAREARLNASLSQQEYRERRFRMLQQDASARIAEQQRSVERIRAQIQSQARRIAFE